ncbi:MAG: cytochrome c [Planctomycetes bacterium]|nr:cytochrome c [Planctomycetota bacterium]
MRIAITSALSLALLLLACAHGNDDRTTTTGTDEIHVAAPLPQAASYYDKAMTIDLGQRAPEESTGLHNVYHLSDNIISGSEPHGEVALAKLKEMGVKTVLSVDGMPPEAELAAKYGLRYVHVPIQYAGIHDEEIRKIAKTFSACEGPFYVHCFHGKHRGPAGAAIGRLVLDGASREEALAEMRQWCGTSKKYEGLFRTIATAEIPDAKELADYRFDFPAKQRLGGMVPLMSPIARAHDNVADLMANDFKPDPSHPDVDALNEAKKLHAFLAGVHQLAAEENRPADFQKWSAESEAAARRLVDELIDLRAGKAQALQAAKDGFGEVKTLCGSCHKVYRDHE